jgi:F-type H+-transporting ATPase subunit alpha
LRQPQHTPLRLADEVALMLAVQAGLLDPLPLAAATAFRIALPAALDRGAPDIIAALAKTPELDAPMRSALMETLAGIAASLADDAAGPAEDGSGKATAKAPA